VRQDIAQTTVSGTGSERHAGQGDTDALSSYLAAMTIVVGLIIAWVSLCVV